MFIVSVFYINNSFDKWFSGKNGRGFKESSLEVTNAYYLTAKRKNYHFAERVANGNSAQTSKPVLGPSG